MFRTISDFAETWTRETEGTLKLFGQLDERSLAQAIAPERRTLGRLAWHITTTMREMMGEAKVDVAGPNPDDARPPLPEIVHRYEAAAKALLDQVRAHWTDEKLGEAIPMYGEQWTRGAALELIVLHQAHHRGQMTVLMRQAGLKVPGLYGPAYEEWAAMNMPPQP